MSKKDFNLKNNDKEFSSRCDDIFGGLEKVQNGLTMNKIDIQPMRKRKSNNKPNSTEISSNKTPNKWVCYDLSDVSESSGSQNTGAALSFLHDLEKRKKIEKGEEEVDQPNQEEEEEEVDMEVEVVGTCNSFKKSHVYQAPECVVGKKFEKKPKLKTSKNSNATLAQGDKVDLDHLHENVSAIDFTAEVMARYEQNNPPPSCDDAMDEDQTAKLQKFKSNKKKIVQRNVRQRRDSE